MSEIEKSLGFNFKEEAIELDEGWFPSRANIFGEINTKLDVFREVYYYGNEKDFQKLLLNMIYLKESDAVFFCCFAFTASEINERGKEIIKILFKPERFESILISAFESFYYSSHNLVYETLKKRKEIKNEFVEVTNEKNKESKNIDILRTRLFNNFFKSKLEDMFKKLHDEVGDPIINKKLIEYKEYTLSTSSELQKLPLLEKWREIENSKLKERQQMSKDYKNNPKMANSRKRRQKKGRKI